MRKKIFRRLHRFSEACPPLHRFIKFRLLKRVAQLIQKKDLPCAIAGGYAYEAIRQDITRQHDDIDVTLLYEDRNEVISTFKKAGFSIIPKTPYRALARSKTEQAVDLLMWRNAGKGFVENVHYFKGIAIRIPRNLYLDRRIIRLRSVPLCIPSNEYFVCTTSFMLNGRDREFVKTLPCRPMRVDAHLADSEEIVEPYQEWLKRLTPEEREQIFRHRIRKKKFEIHRWQCEASYTTQQKRAGLHTGSSGVD